MRTDKLIPFPDSNFKFLRSTYNLKDLFTFKLNEDSEIEIKSDDKYIELQEELLKVLYAVRQTVNSHPI